VTSIVRLRAFLRDHGIAEQTFVAFTSDNGPEGKDSAPGSTAEFRGRKRSLHEGGIRVPSLIEYPAEIAVGAETSVPTGTVDYFPTIMELAGFTLPDSGRPMDGTSLLPVMRGEMALRPSPLAFQYGKQWALSDNQFKLFSPNKGNRIELYDLLKDPGETKNIAVKHPDVVKKMTADYWKWKASCEASNAGADYR